MKQTGLKIFILGSILVGCSHSPTKDLLTTDFLLQKDVKQITFQGDNERPRFSANSNRLIYSSRGRGNQKNLQIYETDLIRNKERRVTFQDGDAFDPSYISEMEMIYSSTTDEIKESPFLNRNPSKEYPPADLYMSDRFGAEILRITKQPGYDAESFLLQHPTKPTVIFTSRRGEVTGIFHLDLKTGYVSLLSAETGRDRRSPTLSPDKSAVAFIDTNLESKQQSLQLVDIRTKQTALLKSDEGQYRDLFFAPRSPARLFYSILRKGEKKHQIEVYNLDTKCTQVVFKGSDSLMYPSVSNELKERVAFTRTFQDKKQIYIVDLPLELGPCLEKPVVEIKTDKSVVNTNTISPVIEQTTLIPAAANPATQNSAVSEKAELKPAAKRAVKRKPIPPSKPVPEPEVTPAPRTIAPEPSPATTPAETPAVKTNASPAASPVPVETPTPAPSPVK
ncbi:PD40 domain-containing protein [Bdellovibrio sp. SKB1291214]|uniref:PD40 domain-containing protein n=1 Tax=Bdellovibrio sp. SKB1291214 TaxID=1732569 RepID=UPI000B51A4AF|nr:PD40 domain-containing protein [Bdellovibrio sp. SKB1291214]UYL08712.1 PD40 domain-containing protein [Bdellovibrio sp. SKB1291214]